MHKSICSSFLSRLDVYLLTQTFLLRKHAMIIVTTRFWRARIGFVHVVPKNDILNTLGSRNQSDIMLTSKYRKYLANCFYEKQILSVVALLDRTRVKCLCSLPTYGTYPLCKNSRLCNLFVSLFRYDSSSDQNI